MSEQFDQNPNNIPVTVEDLKSFQADLESQEELLELSTIKQTI